MLRKKVFTIGLIFGFLCFFSVVNALVSSQAQASGNSIAPLGLSSTMIKPAPFYAADTVNTTTTTTTIPETSTTTTTPEGPCITIDPAEVTVNGINDVTTDVKVTINRSGLGSLTAADLAKLEVSFSAACSPYVTVNTVNYAISDDTAQGTVNITVKGTAPSTECTLTIKDPTPVLNPPLNCEATFTITSTAEACKILSIQPSGIKVGLGLIPRIRRVTVTLNVDLQAAGITTGDLNFENAPKGVTILSAQISGKSITALILFWGVTPGTYNVNLGPCGTIPFVISRF